MIPANTIILLSGIPSTGKSTFGRHLAREHGFAHYDLECHPHGWAQPALKDTWDRSRLEFVTQLRQRHKRVALDWGFPVSCLSWVRDLQSRGVHLIWFAGDIARARNVFVQREGLSLTAFDAQV